MEPDLIGNCVRAKREAAISDSLQTHPALKQDFVGSQKLCKTGSQPPLGLVHLQISIWQPLSPRVGETHRPNWLHAQSPQHSMNES